MANLLMGPSGSQKPTMIQTCLPKLYSPLFLTIFRVATATQSVRAYAATVADEALSMKRIGN